MANVFGEIGGAIGREVAEGLTKKVAPAVAKAAKKTVKAVEDKADDWGWKGGKPGEVTAGDVTGAKPFGYSTLARRSMSVEERKAVDAPLRKAIKQFESHAKRKPDSPISVEYKRLASRRQRPDAARYLLRYFEPLEQAGVPRKWTGKVVSAALKRQSTKPSSIASNGALTRIAETIRPLTEQQRDTFLSLYPEWEGSLDDLANAAKNL